MGARFRRKRDRCAELPPVKIRTEQREFLETQAIAQDTTLGTVTQKAAEAKFP